MSRFHVVFLLAAFAAIALPATGLMAAAITTDSLSNATGITSLVVDSVLYDVVFEPAGTSFNEIFGNGNPPAFPPTFASFSAASDAANAIDATLNSQPALVSVGLGSSNLAFYLIPYQYDPVDFNTLFAADTGAWTLISSEGGTRDYEVPNASFAVFTPVVPEPSTLALAAFGFTGLVAWIWRRRNR